MAYLDIRSQGVASLLPQKWQEKTRIFKGLAGNLKVSMLMMPKSRKTKLEFRRTLLSDEFARRCLKNNRYTLRSFARDLAIEPSTVSQLIRGKRTFNDHYFSAVCRALNWAEEKVIKDEQAYIESKTSLKMIPPEHTFVRTHWYCFAILELTHVKHFKPSIKWIAKTLKLHPQAVEEAVRKMIETGALIITEEDRWIDNYGNVTFIENEDMDIETGREHQKGLLDCAKTSIDKNSGEAKSHTNITFAMSKHQVPVYKQLVKEFRERLLLQMQEVQNPKDAVYCAQINLFPLTDLDLEN